MTCVRFVDIQPAGCRRSHTSTPPASAFMLAQVSVLQDDGPHPEALQSSLLEACIAAEDLSSQCAPQGSGVIYPL